MKSEYFWYPLGHLLYLHRGRPETDGAVWYWCCMDDFGNSVQVGKQHHGSLNGNYQHA